jgi:hypothetical protein
VNTSDPVQLSIVESIGRPGGNITGRIDAAGHNAALDSLIAYLEGARVQRRHLGTFLDEWRASRRPAPMHVPVPAQDRVVMRPEGIHVRSEDVVHAVMTGTDEVIE